MSTDYKKECELFLGKFFKKKFPEITVSKDKNGNDDQAYATLLPLKNGEISLWCEDNLDSDDGTIKKGDIFFWLCLERDRKLFGPNKSEAYDFLEKKYGQELCQQIYWEGKKIKNQKLFFEFSSGIVYISYCFKKKNSKYKDERADFFKQLIEKKLISDEEIMELKNSIVMKDCEISNVGLDAGNIIQKWWKEHKNDDKIQQIINYPDFIYQKQRDKLQEWLSAEIDSEKIEPISKISNPTSHKDNELEAIISSLSDSEKELLIHTIEIVKEKNPIELNLYSNKVPLARALSRYKLGKEVGDAFQKVLDYYYDPIHLIPLNDKKREMACSILRIEKTDEALLQFFDDLSLENAICKNVQNQTKLYCEILWWALGLGEKGDFFENCYWLANTDIDGKDMMDFFVADSYWESGKKNKKNIIKSIQSVKKGDILIAKSTGKKGPGHSVSFLRIKAVGLVASDMKLTDKPEWYSCSVNWVKLPQIKEYEGAAYGKYLGTMHKCKEEMLNEIAKEILIKEGIIMPNNPEKEYAKYVDFLKKNHNIILHGAPGTGKTYLAKKIAKAMGCGDNEIGFVQFHQSYDYTDFVEGLRPAKGENGKADGFELKDGEFKAFCKKAIESSKTGVVDNYDECFQKMVAKLETDNVIPIPLISGKGNFYIALNSDGDGFVTMLKDEESGKFIRDTTRFFNYDQCYNVYRGLPGTPKKGFDNYRKAIVKYMNENLGLKKYQEGKNTETSQSKKFVFIIDEINRGEMSKIFGELFYSIDPGYRGEAGRIKTQYQNLVPKGDVFEKGFYVPVNVYIIGTMNDIDRSVESMDFAMRRRFAFKEITADERIEMLDSLKCGKKNEAVKCMQALNKEIESISGLSSAYHVGPAYFLKLDNYEGKFEDLWKYHIEGVLREYLRGMPKAADHLNKLKECYDKSIASESSVSSDKVGDSVENS